MEEKEVGRKCGVFWEKKYVEGLGGREIWREMTTWQT